jgi:hypothetical protein
MTLVLSKGDTGEGVIEELREYMGPPDVEQAKEKSPEWYHTLLVITHLSDNVTV